MNGLKNIKKVSVRDDKWAWIEGDKIIGNDVYDSPDAAIQAMAKKNG